MKLLNTAKKITTAAAALALAAGLLAPTAAAAHAAEIDRNPGPLGRYIAPAAVERVFPAANEDGTTETVYWFLDDDGERWIICADHLAEITGGDLPEQGQRVDLVMNANGTPEDFEDDYFDGVLWCTCCDD